MKKLSFLFIFSFVVLLSNAQQRLLIEKISNGETKTVVLPAVAYVKFKNGAHKKLLLEKLVSDSLIFKKYYNQSQNYDCTLGDISAINFPKKGDASIRFSFFFFTYMAVQFTPLTIAGFFHQSTDAGDPTQSMAILLGIPLSTISIITSAALINKLPKKYKTKKWRIYVK